MKYKIWLSKDKINHILTELGDKVTIIEQDDPLIGIEITVNSSAELIRLFYAGYFCAMDQAKVLY